MNRLIEYRDYKSYLNDWIRAQPGKGRGVRSELARAAQCQLAYISRVLATDTADFSLEQAEKISEFMNHADREIRYFLLLVQYARAGTASLKNRYLAEIKEAQEKQLYLKDRLGVKQPLSLEAQTTYYSAWYYAAIHVLLTAPKFQTKKEIAAALGLSLKKVSEVLAFLASVDLAREEKGRFVTGQVRIHLGADSPLIAKHHINWRIEAIRSLEREDRAQSNDLHYSSVVTLSDEDRIRVKSILVKAIEEAKAIVRDSPSDKLCSFSLDLYGY
ncbi:MAG TPA: TIGR02147 family protein [Bdellovibrionota bacterium]|nr:TIGR02147 family protein [Bdellovibrionota bacterium]